MKKITLILTSLLVFTAFNGQAKKLLDKKEKVSVGIYITSIHDIDFKQKEYTVNFWLWLKYKNKDFDFLKNLEVPLAKTVTQSFSTVDSSNNGIYILMKVQCVMKDSWK